MKLKRADDAQVKRWIRQGKKFVCFGAGKLLKELCCRTELENAIEWIVDNDPGLWKEPYRINGASVCTVSPDKIEFSDRTDTIILLTTTYYMQVLKQIQSLSNWDMVHKIYYFPTEADRCYNRFAWIWRRLRPQRKIIFRSGPASYAPGWDFRDNARALFEYMVERGYHKTYKLIWYLHEPDQYPQLRSMKNVRLISYEWEKSHRLKDNVRYFYHLCSAGYLFTTDTHFWMRYCNKGQIRVNLWHGCGFKDRKIKTPTGENYDYMTVVSPLYADIHAERFGVSREKMIDTGLAKEDLLFHPPEKELSDLLHVGKAGKYVFWLPTFRMAIEGMEKLNEYELNSDTGLSIVNTVEKAQKLNELLEEKDIALIIKIHPLQRDASLLPLNFSRIFVIESSAVESTGYQINTLLSKADALISDYSSAAVDYMLLDRPIAFALEDEEQYRESRGFVFDNIHDYLPGKELYTYRDLEQFLTEIAEETDSTKDKRRRLIRKMHSHQDGNNCKRILETIGLGGLK